MEEEARNKREIPEERLTIWSIRREKTTSRERRKKRNNTSTYTYISNTRHISIPLAVLREVDAETRFASTYIDSRRERHQKLNLRRENVTRMGTFKLEIDAIARRSCKPSKATAE